MASLLRQIVARPRARHHEANLDLCYVTDNIIATSGPSGTYPQRAYRNPLPDLVRFLNSKHGDHWCIWEFRAEGTGYPDEAVFNRIWHFPWPDHHPPPFRLLPNIVASMRDWRKKDEKNVIVVHCKAGKGRSGTSSISYLVSEEGWALEDALKRFTERRMREGWGNGISIPSQLRWLRYVDRWTKHGKHYCQRKVEVLELHVYGLRDGVKLAVQGFTDEGKKIKTFHTFRDSERKVVRGKIKDSSMAETVMELLSAKEQILPSKPKTADQSLTNTPPPELVTSPTSLHNDTSGLPNGPAEEKAATEQGKGETTGENGPGADAIFQPKHEIILETSDINIDVERRSKGAYTWAVPTSVAHVWFNVFFEGNGPEQEGKADESGVFEIEWDALDGLKGSSRKGTRAFDRLAVLWKALPESAAVVEEPKEGEQVQQAKPADWKGEDHHASSDSEDEGTQSFVVE